MMRLKCPSNSGEGRERVQYLSAAAETIQVTIPK